MKSLYDILDQINELSTSSWEKGDRFERLIKGYLETDPIYRSQFSRVWRWIEWAGREGKPDTGIDLVAQYRDTEEYCAIQCKFYSSTYTLQKKDIDSFFTASGKDPFTDRLIFSTTDKWSKHAEAALEAQTKPIARVRVQDLIDSPVDWDQFNLDRPEELTVKPKKTLLPHQQKAVDAVTSGFKSADRGKLIMACGTGKTFTSLQIAETVTPRSSWILFLVPSIALLQQTLKEWAGDSQRSMRAYAVCSDSSVGRRKRRNIEDISIHDLAIPASTNADRLAEHALASEAEDLTVIFSTYQSIQVLNEAQGKGIPDFDLIICDEAHRTTGVTFSGEDESAFVKVHNQDFLKAKKRLYMTATPRIYTDDSKSKAAEADALLCSMDDVGLFGEEFHRLGFGEAVNADLLTDYKVLVLAVDEKYVARSFQSQLAGDNELTLGDAVKIVGCWNGLAKRDSGNTDSGGFEADPEPMRRAVAFSRSIKDSRKITGLFGEITDYLRDALSDNDRLLECKIQHVDGTYNVLRRNQLLDWLKEAQPSSNNECRILSNARCLSEGVDVPALDSVLFLNPRDSVVDVVQSVGRVMRKSEGKKYGYIILPIGVPADIPPEVALADNRHYRVVWQVLQALRAHDDRFNALINKIELNENKDDQLQIIGVGEGSSSSDTESDLDSQSAVQAALVFPNLEEWRDAIYAKIVQKCGDRRYWESWAKDIAKIADTHITRINGILSSPSQEQSEAFDKFMTGMRESINPEVTQEQAIEMLAQHLITRPVFDALFEDYAFADHNPVSQAMQQMLEVLDHSAIDKERARLERFYSSVQQRAAGIDNAQGKQRIILELYEQFFKTAFPKMTDRLGIVYTPVQVVDFIINSAEAALHQEFGASISDPGVHVIDPFSGTGTFMVRLLHSGLISPEMLKHKYENELHANEIVLLAYYIAAINIEATYHYLVPGEYTPFEGIVLTDTFQLSENAGSFSNFFPENNQRAVRQQAADIRVIIGNPPYSAGQTSANDNNPNVDYPYLDERIRGTYAAGSTAGLKRHLYDSYIRAIRWATDRIGDKGVICFVTNGSFIDSNVMDGVRKTLSKEFSKIYCFNLRGNQRTAGERSRKEGGKIFGSGSRSPVAITVLIKNPGHSGPPVINYYDIGDYLKREEKLNLVSDLADIRNISWDHILPNANHDWINQRDPAFNKFLALGDKSQSNNPKILFLTYSLGVSTNRDAWTYNFDATALFNNISRMIDFYNDQVSVYQALMRSSSDNSRPDPNDVIDTDPARISWSAGLIKNLTNGVVHTYSSDNIVTAMYRPFIKQHLYFDRSVVERPGRNLSLFPEQSSENMVISVTGRGATRDFSAFITDQVPDLELISKGQCFPRYYYAHSPSALSGQTVGLGAASSLTQHDAIRNSTLELFRTTYTDHRITNDDIFYYVYGVLHSPEYRYRFEADLRRMLPRIPLAEEFRPFSEIGRNLAYWHLNYENVEPWPLVELTAPSNWSERSGTIPMRIDPRSFYRVSRMRFGKNGKEVDKSIIVVNSYITLSGIPINAYEYVVNGKPAIEWIMDRYQVSTDKASGILNDPNEYSSDPRYIIDLLKRIVRVSIETNKIVDSLPALNERDISLSEFELFGKR